LRGPEVVRFMRMTLLRFVAEGNAVLACIDEGCGKQEDLIAMMSTADGIVRIELIDGSKTFDVLKHPLVEPTKIDVPMTWRPAIPFHIDAEMLAQHVAIREPVLAKLRQMVRHALGPQAIPNDDIQREQAQQRGVTGYPASSPD
jgi:hypothetical protein